MNKVLDLSVEEAEKFLGKIQNTFATFYNEAEKEDTFEGVFLDLLKFSNDLNDLIDQLLEEGENVH